MASRSESAGPYPLLRARAGLGWGLACLGAAGLGGGLAGAGLLGPAAILRAVAVPVLLGVLALPFLGQHPYPRLGPANQLTLLRAVLAAGLAAPLADPGAGDHGLWWAAFGLLAFFLDGVDGWVARRSGMASAFGARLDMELDGLTTLLLSALVWQVGAAGPWVLLAGALRYLFVAAAWVWPFLSAPLPPAERRRFVCGLGFVLLSLALVPWPWGALGTLCAAVAVLALVGSFAIDTAWLVRHRPR